MKAYLLSVALLATGFGDSAGSTNGLLEPMTITRGDYYALVLGGLVTYMHDAPTVIHFDPAEGVFWVDVFGARTSANEAKDSLTTLRRGFLKKVIERAQFTYNLPVTEEQFAFRYFRGSQELIRYFDGKYVEPRAKK